MSSMSEDSNGARRRKSSNTYTKQDLKNAINLIVERGISIRRAAFICNVPRTTLSTYLKSLSYGKISKLLPPEEQALYQWMTDCCKRGFTIKKGNVETAAEALVGQKSVPARTHPFQDTEFGRRCYQKFARRWLSIERVKERKHLGPIADWFLHIERYLIEANQFGILNHPDRVFLCDELRFRERVEMRESVRTVLKKMTMLYTFSAAGAHLSPLLVYPYRRDVPPDIVKAAPKNCAIVAHEYGQVTPKTFAAYLDKVVDKFVTANGILKPVIVFVDETQVDLTLHLHNSCKRLGIVLLGLSGAQVSKPTANVFNDICTGWEQELPRWEVETGRSFTLADCAGLMQPINQRFIKSAVLVQDFATSNLCPWNRPVRDVSTVPASPAIEDDADDDMEPDDDEDDDDDDNEIENFLENVDEWSDRDDEDDEFDEDEFMDELDEDDEDDEEEEEMTKEEGKLTVDKEMEKKEENVETVNQQPVPSSTTEKADDTAEGEQVKPSETPSLATPSTSATGDANEKTNGAGDVAKKDEEPKVEPSNNVPNSPPSDDEDGPPDDIDISINFIDFKRAIGGELTEKFERKLEIENQLTLGNHAENVLYDIYRQFRCDIVTDSDDDYDIVEIGDD